MNIDEAIKHCEEVAWENDRKAMCVEEAYQTTEQQNCEQCAADHRQLAEWLTELKELRNSVGAFKLVEMKDALNLISEYKAELFEAKRLLKASVEDIYKARIGGNCELCCIPQDKSKCDYDMGSDCQFKWRYADEALKLIGGSENG